MFSRETPDGVCHVPGYFHTPTQLVADGHVLDTDQILSHLNAQVENFNKRGSNFVLERVTRFVVSIARYRPLHGSSYIKTPRFLANKRCLVNVHNNDNRCFLWAVLSALYEPEKHKERLSNYVKYEYSVNLGDLQFPVKTKDIPKFEHLNPTLSINVMSFDDETKGFTVEYLSPEHDREQHINLLLLSEYDETRGTTKCHYTWIRNMSALVAHRTKHRRMVHVCNSCLHPFSSKQVLDEHAPYCLRHAPQQVVYPDPLDPNDCIMKFKDVNKQHKISYYLVCDFESFLTPLDRDDDEDKNTRSIEEHQVSGFCCYRVTDLPQHQTEPVVYSGPDVMTHFYRHIMSESEKISEILREQKPMTPLSPQELAQYRKATVCGNCNEAFTHRNYKVRHHCHVTGDFLFAACNNCNLQLKPKKCKATKRHPTTEDEQVEAHFNDNYFLPIVFHNLKCYDGHFIIKNFAKKYVEHRGKDEKVTYDDVKVIPLNGEKYVQFQIGNLRFLDSFQFLSTSLDNLVSLLLRSGKESFCHTTKFLGHDDVVFAKGVYPYSYMTDRSKFAETQLPPIDAFYDRLKDEPLAQTDYERARLTWSKFNMVNMHQYHDHYLLLDVLLLADVFEHFRKSVFEQHGLDCLHFPTLPSVTWSAALRHTGAKLELITDPAAYLMLENSMRGGIASISKRHAKANNPYVEGYDESLPTTYITYLDANNLYGKAQSEPLPVGNFVFLSEREVEEFDLMSVAPDAETGYIIECDLAYPPHFHDSHNDYPLAPEHVTISHDMLSPFSANLIDSARPWKPSEKLVPNLYDKTRYVCHYRNLQFYLKHGLVLTKIHRILSFSQSPWLKPWIDLCTEQRKAAKTDFESDLAKLQANATFGKTMEQVRNRVNIRLIADENKLMKAVAKTSFRKCEIINEDLVMVRGARQKVKLNKPIAVGFTILENSKLIMYEFYYGYLKARYGDACRLLFTDTDSLCCEIRTDDIYADMGEDLEHFDTSNFEPTHPLYSNKNHRVLAKMKSETGSSAPEEFVGLKAKMYSLHVPVNPKTSQKKAKGIPKHYVHKRLRHENYLKILQNANTISTCKFRAFRSINHVLNTVEISKLCLAAFDDKRYILDDGVHTLAYGHHTIGNGI